MTQSDDVRDSVACQGSHFADRAAGGRAVAAQLMAYVAQPQTLVLAVARGGVPVGVEVARALGAPLELLLVRRIEVPSDAPQVLGAIVEGGPLVLHEPVVAGQPVPALITRIATRATEEINGQAWAYRGARAAPSLRHQTIILVDDGVLTGMTMRAAIAAVRAQAPARLIVAVPVAAQETVAALALLVETFIVAVIPAAVGAIDLWYTAFPALSDDEVRRLVQQVADARTAQRQIPDWGHLDAVSVPPEGVPQR